MSICFPQLKLADQPNEIIKSCSMPFFGLLAVVQIGRICPIVIRRTKAFTVASANGVMTELWGLYSIC